jgi:hypothetical protein
MKRTLITGMIAAALLVAGGCQSGEKKAEGDKTAAKGDAAKGGEVKADDAKGGEAKADDAAGGEAKPADAVAAAGGAADAAAALKYVPDASAIVAQMNLKSLVALPGAEAGVTMALAMNPDAKPMMDALAGCEMSWKSFEVVTIGVDPMTEGASIVVAGPGVGKLDNIKCLAGKSTDGKVKLEQVDGKDVLSLGGGESYGHMVDDNHLVIATKGWNDTVKGLVAGTGTSVAAGGLKDVMARADQSQEMWFAMKIPADLAAGMKGSPVEKVTDVAGSLDIKADNAIAFAVSMGAGTADDAAAVSKGLTEMKPLLAASGAPADLTDKIKIESAEAIVNVTLELTAEDLAKLQAMAAGPAMAAGGAPAPAPAGDAVAPAGDAAPAGEGAEKAAEPG